MAEERVTIRLDTELRGELQEFAHEQGKSESDVVREALRTHLARRKKKESALELARRIGFIGVIKGGPRDVSTNKKYFRGFGRGK